MPSKADLPCADCGKLMWRGTTSLPEGQARCQPCRRLRGASRAKTASEIYRSTPIECPQCARTFTPGRTTQTYCTKACSREASRRYATCPDCGKRLGCYRSERCTPCAMRRRNGWQGGRELVHLAGDIPPLPKKRKPRAPKARRNERVWYSGMCAHCGKGYADIYWRSTCSAECSEQHAKAVRNEAKLRRRALMRDAYISPVNRRQLFERDNWTCQICHEPVERDKVVPHPKAPTIDHVIPLARGGTHEMANAQCADFLCNATKSDRTDWSPALVV